jgi:predicted nucleotidyltransferase component of viral defense system
MNEDTLERLQKKIAKTIASGSGRQLLLIGGFRYRLIDNSIRQSMDIDYHCLENIDEVKKSLISLFNRRLFPEIKREFGLDGSIIGKTDLEKTEYTIELSFYNQTSRFEIPVDLINITCMDNPEIRIINGLIYLTVSDADMVESKILSLISRLQDRDLLDLYLFKDRLLPNSANRLQKKLNVLNLSVSELTKLIKILQKNYTLHVKNLNKIIEERVNKNMQEMLQSVGTNSILDSIIELLKTIKGAAHDGSSVDQTFRKTIP